VASLTESAAQYQALLGLEPQPSSTDDHLAAQLTAFQLGQTTLTLAQPADQTSPLQPYLNAGGQRPYSFTLRIADTSAEPTRLDPNLTHGAQIKLK